MRLRRGLRVVRTGDDEVQIGTDPRWAVRLHGLSPAQCRAVLHGADRSLLPVLPEPVLTELNRLGLLRPAPVRSGPLPDRLVPDCGAAALVETGDPRQVQERRSAATVAVSGLSRTGVLVATALAGAGIGTVLVADRRPVTMADIGTGLHPQDVGMLRQTATAQLLRTVAPGVLTGSTDRWGQQDSTVVVTVSTDVVDPEQCVRLISAGLPHLPVVLREADALVGPMALPGQPGCPRCVELFRADLDPRWPRVLGLLCTDRPSSEPVALATVTAGLAATQVLNVVDGDQPVTAGRQYEVPLPAMEPRLRTWAAHPDCGCAALPMPTAPMP